MLLCLIHPLNTEDFCPFRSVQFFVAGTTLRGAKVVAALAVCITQRWGKSETFIGGGMPPDINFNVRPH